jgi:GTP-binding protein LepA
MIYHTKTVNGVRMASETLLANARTDQMDHASASQTEFILNLIDTPGHVDFGYEVSRSLAACEGAILVVDATQGVQAQTLANLNQARKHNLVIIPVLNKIDMPHARIEEVENELVGLGFEKKDMLHISAKTGQNVETVLEAVVARIPPPSGDSDKPLRALIFSSQFDQHKGVVVFVRIVDGSISYDPHTSIHFFATNADVTPIDVGFFAPKMTSESSIRTGEVGYIATGLKDVRYAKVGDTITIGKVQNVHVQPPRAQSALPGYKEPKSMVFLSLFPINSDEFSIARESLEKLRLSDSAFTFRPINSAALGNGFHCGFLGLLHAEIVQERLSREFNLDMIATAPSVEYHLTLNHGVSLSKLGFTVSDVISEETETNGAEVIIQSATEYPDPTYIGGVKEPIMEVKIFTPKKYIGSVMQLAVEKRGEYIDLTYMGDQAEFTYLIPLSDMIIDFFDRLKSISEGYASLDYEFFEYQPVEVAKIDILVNHDKVDALAFLAVREQAHRRAAEIVEKLAEIIPRQQFAIPIQGAIGGSIITRSDVKAFRKDVIAHLYGGDRTRKDKLLKKQVKGKAKMKRIGSVDIPQSAFFEVLKRD